jgi:hypothetical protein
MTTKLNFGRDIQGYNAFAPAMSDVLESASILSGAETSFTVPGDVQNWIAVFSYQAGSDVWVAINGTATPPAGNTFSTTNSFLQPAQLTVHAGDTISCYNNGSSNSDVGVALYADS